MGGLVGLAAGPLELHISPENGGSIVRFDWIGASGTSEILRSMKEHARSITDASCFPLVPFVNRVRGGTFEFRGRQIRLAPNMPGDRSPLHGQGWLARWQVEARDERAAALSFRHEPGEWPWAYEARQNFALDENGLSLSLSCRNLSGEAMPCGLGQHPYFHCMRETVLETRVSNVWTIDENVLPVEKVPAEGRYDLSNRDICGQGLDHGFDGWGGTARIHTPGAPFEIVLSSPQARFFQLYSPPEGGLFVAEPVSHANAAMNAPEEEWEELGFRALDPGEEMVLDMRLDVKSRESA